MYVRLAILAATIRKVYIEYKWVAKEYLHHSREKLWDAKTTKYTLKCFNIERIIEAALNGTVKPEELTMHDLIIDSEKNGREIVILV